MITDPNCIDSKTNKFETVVDRSMSDVSLDRLEAAVVTCFEHDAQMDAATLYVSCQPVFEDRFNKLEMQGLVSQCQSWRDKLYQGVVALIALGALLMVLAGAKHQAGDDGTLTFALLAAPLVTLLLYLFWLVFSLSRREIDRIWVRTPGGAETLSRLKWRPQDRSCVEPRDCINPTLTMSVAFQGMGSSFVAATASAFLQPTPISSAAAGCGGCGGCGCGGCGCGG